MSRYKDLFSIDRMAKVLGVSRGGFYKYLKRPLSARAQEDVRLGCMIKRVNSENRQVYGYRRLRSALMDEGEAISKSRVIRLMKKYNIVVRYKKPFRTTTQSDHENPISPNILSRDFSASRPNEKWVSDISYIPTQAGFLYLAVIIDLFSRMVVGMCISSSLSRHVLLNAFNQASVRRNNPEGILFHSDQGVQYASEDFRERLANNLAIQSMSRRGNCWDNAVSESFFCTLKRELMLNRKFSSKEEARNALFDYVEVFYNRKRKHSSLGYLPPSEFEGRFIKERIAVN